jgi:hypothetical protein
MTPTPADQQAQGVTEERLRQLRNGFVSELSYATKSRDCWLSEETIRNIIFLIDAELSRRSPVRPEQREVCSHNAVSKAPNDSVGRCAHCGELVLPPIPAAQSAPREGERDEVIAVSVALDRIHVRETIDAVKAVAADRTDAYWSGFAMACEEITHRLSLPAAPAATEAAAKPNEVKT